MSNFARAEEIVRREYGLDEGERYWRLVMAIAAKLGADAPAGPRLVIKARIVKNPGSRGGQPWWDKEGNVRYGVRPQMAAPGATNAVTPWPAGFPDVFVQTNVKRLYRAGAEPGETLDARGRSRAYLDAKAGDSAAAIRVIADVVKPETFRSLARRFPGAHAVAVHAEEAGGRNKLALALAEALEGHAGLPVDVGIGQSNRVFHTGKAAAARLLASPTFRGPVVPGRNYILVDDVVTTGSTLAALRAYVESQGGHVVGTAALAASSNAQTGYSGHLALRKETADTIAEKFDIRALNDLLSEYGIASDFRHLSNSQARYLAGFRSVDAIRVRLTHERSAGSAGVHARAKASPSVRKAAVNPHLLSRLVLKARVKAFQRTNPVTGKVATVLEHFDKRPDAKLRVRVGRPPATRESAPTQRSRGPVGDHVARQAAATPDAQKQRRPAAAGSTEAGNDRMRYATLHSSGPDSPGYQVRLTPHPGKPGVWRPHPEDFERAKQAIAGNAPADGADAAPTKAGGVKPASLDDLCGKYGGCEDHDPVGKVPGNLEQLERDVDGVRKQIAATLAGIGDTERQDFRNSATSIEELLSDAQASEQSLRDLVGASAAASGGEANFGPGGRFALKSPDSLRRKVQARIIERGGTEADIAARISDAVRGSVLVDTPAQLKQSAEALRAAVGKAGGKVFVDDKFQGDNPYGYGGIHADLQIPVPGTNRFISAEVQLHLRAVNDGTMASVKEQAHKIYELSREGRADGRMARAASLLMFMSAYAPLTGAV